MRVVLAPAAEEDADEQNSWWREHRPDSPDLFDDEIAACIARLEEDAAAIVMFRRVGLTAVRRIHLAGTRRHVYFVIDEDHVTILAIWGSVRRVLPRLRERALVPR